MKGAREGRHPETRQAAFRTHKFRNELTSPKRKKESKKVKLLSRIRLFVTPWTVAHQAPPCVEFSRQEYWVGLPFPSPGDLPDPGMEPGYHQPKGFCTFRPSITNTYHDLEERDLSVGMSAHARSQAAWLPLQAKVRLVLCTECSLSNYYGMPSRLAWCTQHNAEFFKRRRDLKFQGVSAKEQDNV